MILCIITEVMPRVNKYPFSEKFCWITDKFGVSWQLSKASANG